MKNKISYLVLLFSVSCLPSSWIENKKEKETKEAKVEFEIKPTGEWFPNCHDDPSLFKSDKKGAVLGYQKRLIFSKDEPSISIVTDFLSQSCSKSSPTVALSRYITGKITYGDHADLDKGMRLRWANIEVTKEYSIAKSEVGLEYVKSVSQVPEGARVDQELVVAAEKFQFSKLYGAFVVHKERRNNMYAYFTDKEKIEKEKVKENLVNNNMYVKNIIK